MAAYKTSRFASSLFACLLLWGCTGALPDTINLPLPDISDVVIRDIDAQGYCEENPYMAEVCDILVPTLPEQALLRECVPVYNGQTGDLAFINVQILWKDCDWEHAIVLEFPELTTLDGFTLFPRLLREAQIPTTALPVEVLQDDAWLTRIVLDILEDPTCDYVP